MGPAAITSTRPTCLVTHCLSSAPPPPPPRCCSSDKLPEKGEDNGYRQAHLLCALHQVLTHAFAGSLPARDGRTCVHPPLPNEPTQRLLNKAQLLTLREGDVAKRGAPQVFALDQKKKVGAPSHLALVTAGAAQQTSLAVPATAVGALRRRVRGSLPQGALQCLSNLGTALVQRHRRQCA